MRKNMFLFIPIFLLLTFNQTSAFINWIRIFNIEFDFSINNEEKKEESFLDLWNIDIEENKAEYEKNIDKLEQIKEKTVHYRIVDPIEDVRFVNDKMYIYLDKDFHLGSYILYINGFKYNWKNKKLTYERKYTDTKYNVYSLKDRFYNNSIFEGKNVIYFKNVNTYEDTVKYIFHNWDYVKYDSVSNRFICKWNIEKYVVYNGDWNKISTFKWNFWNDFFFSSKSWQTTLKNWYHNSFLYCSDVYNEIYYIYNMSFTYSTLYESLIYRNTFWKYYTQEEYFQKMEQNTN